MNNRELQALRKLFFLSVTEAAEHIGGVSARSWQHWESGKYSVPDDVSKKMNDLANHRLNMIEACEEVMNEHDLSTNIDYDISFESYESRHSGSSLIDWRMAQSVASYFLGERTANLK